MAGRRRASPWRWAGIGALVGVLILLIRLASQPVDFSDPDPAERWGAIAGFVLTPVLLCMAVGAAVAGLRNLLWRRR
jgi:hypothetical protein